MPSSPILLLASERADRELLSRLLAGMGHQVTPVADVETALVAASDHQLIVVDMPGDDEGAAGLCRAVRATPGLGELAVLCIAQTDSVEDRVRFLEVGADDVIAKPFDARELEARLETLMLRFQHPLSATATPTPPPVAPVAEPIHTRQLVALFSPKGGVGTTTIAVNLATVLARRFERPGPVAIVDLDLQWGQVGTQLNLAPRMSVIDLARDDAAWDEPEGPKSYAVVHDSRLVVYAASTRPDQSQLVGGDELRRLLLGVRGLHQVVVVDGGSVLDDRALTLFELADRLIIPMTPEIPALRVVHTLLEILSETGGILGKTTFVVNHTFAKDQVRLRDIESAVQARISLELPYDPALYLRAANEGIPLVLGAPKSAPAARFAELATMVTAAPVSPATSETDGDRRGRLTGLLKRG